MKMLYWLPFLGTDDDLTLDICYTVNNEKTCCLIDSLDSNFNNFEQGNLDIFKYDDLRGCDNFKFPTSDEEYSVTASVFLRMSNPFFGDQWRGEFIRFILSTSVSFECPIDTWLEEDYEYVFECDLVNNWISLI